MINSTHPSLSQSAAQETTAPAPYLPSFIDRFISYIERLPIPYGLTYVALFILHSALWHVMAWVDGWLPFPSSNPILFLFPIWQWFPFAIITYLNSLSRGH